MIKVVRSRLLLYNNSDGYWMHGTILYAARAEVAIIVHRPYRPSSVGRRPFRGIILYYRIWRFFWYNKKLW
jgi:hypothetical protein